jgi:branched-chain amino acid transport system ATP-binding protein
MLKVANLSISIGPVAIIRNVSLELAAGETCGLIGRNGAGKTTLMRALMGALPATGTAELAGTDLLSLPPHRRIAQGIGYMPEDRRLVPEFTAEENIRLPSWAAKFPDVAQRLDWIFDVADLFSRAYRIERGMVTRA